MGLNIENRITQYEIPLDHMMKMMTLRLYNINVEDNFDENVEKNDYGIVDETDDHMHDDEIDGYYEM
ncbi:unnamed protein product [Schistosoma mattheei]|uniref:Uncharacterized protein n=1 Tax=Schistosoma mattheei TaxID=31246 RepID=A0A183P4C2_9TREM|nr:unnamed protein product [Schistosoma mattheei]